MLAFGEICPYHTISFLQSLQINIWDDKEIDKAADNLLSHPNEMTILEREKWKVALYKG